MPSRIAGRGALVLTLGRLRTRVTTYGLHRAATAEEQMWTRRLYDALCLAYDQALESEGARASLRAVNDRRRRGSKRTPQEWKGVEGDGLY